MKIILMGPPGSGKGTQAGHIASMFDVNCVSSGDLFRDNLAKNTELGKLAKDFMDKGEYVPDEVTIEMVMEWIEKPSHASGFVLDGFPRTLTQAEALESRLLDSGGIDRVLFFNVGEETLVDRLSGRLICRTCHMPHHIKFSPPLITEKCNSCGGGLYQRDDDKVEVIRNRLDVYMQETEPLVKHFRELGNLREIDASEGINDVKRAIEKAVR
ncbi:MAG: adenylate kinase [Chloroflexota bacterium]|nr:adenylate kinase [Chloroflexota bacterium]